jgi:DNA-binding response OmpR family regulator
MSVRVLVVDDDPLLLRAISKVLARHGFDVVTADDALPALAVDNIFVAVLTGEGTEPMRAECLGAGADAVLIKPITPSELRRRLTAAALALETLAAS